MIRLSGTDAGFYYTDNPSQPSTPIFVVTFSKQGELAQQEPSDRLLTTEVLSERIGERLALLPAYTWKLHRIPLGLNHPVWVVDPKLAVEDHVLHLKLVSNDPYGELEGYVALLASRRIPTGGPLWSVTLVDGLPDLRQALVFCVHHSLGDAVAAVTSLRNILDDVVQPDSRPLGDAPETDAGSVVPGGFALAICGLRDQYRAWRKAPGVLRSVLRSAREAKVLRDEMAYRSPTIARRLDACVLNRSYGPQRAVSLSELDMEMVQKVRNLSGYSTTDVLNAAIAGGLRKYLESRGELPSRSLIAAIPVAVDPNDKAPRQWGNHVTQYLVRIATDSASAAERIERISYESKCARMHLEAQGMATGPELMEYAYPFVLLPALEIFRFKNRLRKNKAMADVIISNIPGPPENWSFDGYEVEGIHISGPPVDGIGVNVTLLTNAGRLALAIRTNPEALHEPRQLADDMRSALGELLELALGGELSSRP